MDGRQVQRMRLLERTAAELRLQNTHLSDQLLRMSESVDRATKASHVDRLLSAALIRQFGENGRVELVAADVDALRLELSTPPGVGIYTAKDEARGVWVIEVKANEPAEPIVAAADTSTGSDYSTLNIAECSACGLDHLNLPARPASEAETAQGFLCVATCPNTGTLIYVSAAPRIVEPERPKLIIAP